MRAKIFIFNLLMFNAINAFLELNPDEYTECTRDETLSYSCQSMQNCVIKDVKSTKNLKSAFNRVKVSFFTRIYFQNNYFKIHLFEDTYANRNEITPTLLELLNKIPRYMMIKGGIIHTKGKSLISGINVKDLSIYTKHAKSVSYDLHENKTLTVAPRCYKRSIPGVFLTPTYSYITMDCTYVYVTSICFLGSKLEYYKVSEKYNLQNTVENKDMTCFLYSNNEKDKYNYQQNTTGEKFSGLHFELYFSYTCRLFVRVPITSSEPNAEYSIMPVYQSYKFTLGGYDLKSEDSHKITGLTYLVTQTAVANDIFPE
ncbi:uncharacterized protein LOC142317363 isoform X3 [Lycorma delicatula]|uniref:uncharacterized protein LOC142317363 isoform X3 n=1 Tax=Lycorma delicatula TaxID=130591 RepID=UPI003F50FA46